MTSAGWLLAALLLTGTPPDAVELCQATGEAPLVKNDRARARARATEVALARCAEKVIVAVMADGRAGSGLSVVDRERAGAALRPQLEKDPGRLFLSHRVSSDRAEEGWVQVEVEGRARLGILVTLARAAALGLSRGQAIVGVLVHESTRVGDRSEIQGESLTGGQLARLLHDRGFEIRPVRFVAGQEAGLLDDPRALAARARESQVELLIAGEVVVINEQGSALDRSRAVAIEGRFQVVDNTGRIRGRVPLSARTESGSTLRALSRVLASGELDKLLRQIVPLLSVDATRASVDARTIALSFSGIADFRAGARTLLELLKIIPGVSAIEEVDFHDGRLDAEVQWAGTLEELEIELTTELSRHRGVSDLRVVRRGADRLDLTR